MSELVSITIEISPEKKRQTFDSFGVSGAWWAQFVGGWEHIDAQSKKPCRERIAELLFSENNGIGITCYRYNLGGGSKNSGSCSFSAGNRGAESFALSDRKYDWSRDKNAVWMMKEAVKNGVDEIVLFSNSPPEMLTKNKKACLDKPWFTNLSKKNYLPFARYCFDVAEHFISQGLPICYISPVNEPLWVWTEKHGQEGCHYKPHAVARLFNVFARELENRPRLDSVKLSGAENGDIRWFNRSYTQALMKNERVRQRIDAIDFHSYFLPIVPIGFLNDRIAFMRRFKKWMDSKYPDMPLKMSEWTHMRGGRDYGMDSALIQATVMTEDIDILGVISWQHWIAVSESDFCDGLIYINEDEKTFELTKRYYAFGNFTKFITKGSCVIGTSCADKELKTLAFKKNNETVVIIVNIHNKEKLCNIQSDQDRCMYVTDEEHDLEQVEIKHSGDIRISPKSVNTIVIRDKY
ncbi:MAG: hypothetical protein BWY46_01021 [Firmicutes bacterium ADurb.Bin300]|nr:MAG: hypothetical protein BWY46_01021 [Firmicutes bacterium ADurb.Bin300]